MERYDLCLVDRKLQKLTGTLAIAQFVHITAFQKHMNIQSN